MFSFRNRLIISDPLAAPDNNHRYVVSSDSHNEVVELLGPKGEEPILHAMELRLRGSGYENREAAIEAGKLWRDRVMVAFAHYEKGIEIGSDETPDVPQYSIGQPYFNYDLGGGKRDTPILTVFPTNQEPDWAGFSAEGVVAHGIETFINGHLGWVKQRNCSLNVQQRLAYKLFHAAHFESNPETVYILLFTGVEALIPKGFQKQPFIDVLKQLRSQLATMENADESARESIHKLLSYKENESIRYRGRKWVKTVLGNDMFDDKSCEDFFLRAYDIRNSVAHGNVNRPSTESLNEQIPELRRYLLALLDMDVFGELMPGVLGFERDGTVRAPDAP